MKSHIQLPGLLFEDGVKRSLFTQTRFRSEEFILERHLVPIEEQHFLVGLYCMCVPEVITVGDEDAFLHQSDVLLIPIPSHLPREFTE